jgi:transcriptional regulator with XRE-family HTH domain
MTTDDHAYPRRAIHAVPYLHAWRNARGWTQADLATRSQVARATVERAERGSGVTSAVLYKLAAGLGLSVERLITQDPRRLTPTRLAALSASGTRRQAR